MLGNALEWCQDRDSPYEPGDDVEDSKEDITDGYYRVLCGGSFDFLAVDLRCAFRFRYRPTDRIYDVGFRPARTFR